MGRGERDRDRSRSGSVDKYDSTTRHSEKEEGRRDRSKRRRDANDSSDDSKGGSPIESRGKKRERSKDRDKDRRASSSSRKRGHRERSPSPGSSVSVSTGNTDDEDDSSLDSRRRPKRTDKDRKRRKDDGKKKKKKSKHKKEKKSKKKRTHKDKDRHEDGNRRTSSKTHKKSRSSRDDNNDDDITQAADTAVMTERARNYNLAEALHQLLVEHPTADMSVNTLPLLFIKLGGGTSLDLRQMTDRGAAQALQRVLESLQSFGIAEDEPQVWKWEVPGGGGKAKDERILLRIVRTLLNDIGFTMDAMVQDSQRKAKQAAASSRDTAKRDAMEDAAARTAASSELAVIKSQTIGMLHAFQQKVKPINNDGNGNAYDASGKPSTLPGELGGLCKMILEGESIALDGLPDASLIKALTELFQSCGLELCELEEDDSDDEDGEEEMEKSMGYGLPERPELKEVAKTKLSSVMSACEQAAAGSTLSTISQQRATKGPMRMPSNYQPPEESSDEEGPAVIGAARRKESDVSKELIKKQAEMRARQLKGAVTGQEELMSTDPNQREEWMLVPGKFDFLSSIKSGNPMKSRNFKAQSKAAGDDVEGRVVDPNVKAELDSIMQAHSDARGPTLVEQHRLKKEEARMEKAAAAAGGQTGQWNWNRDKDLDSGRRVDTNALNMVLGGANNLKTKFQGGF